MSLQRGKLETASENSAKPGREKVQGIVDRVILRLAKIPSRSARS